jgi:hypothetical protein
MYLILAPPDDIHALSVAKELKHRGAIVDQMWTAEFPSGWSADWRMSNAARSLTFNHGRKVWRAAEIEGAWLRRIPRPSVPASIYDRDIAHFTRRELEVSLRGILGGLSTNLMNDPQADLHASSKMHQLTVAAEVGLAIPATLVSSDPAAVLAFKNEAPDGIIFKSFTSTSFNFNETRRLTDDLHRLLPAVSLAPTIFQHEIRAEHHLRITYVDG